MPPATMTSLLPARQVVRQHGGLHARAAHLVDRGAAGRQRQAGAERGLAGGRLAEAGGQHAAHDHLLDLLGREAGALDRGLDRDGAELRRGEAGRSPWKPPIGVRATETMTTTWPPAWV
jgi:hypothetical protein